MTWMRPRLPISRRIEGVDMTADEIKEVFILYMQHVCHSEGTDFLGIRGEKLTAANMGDDWTKEQLALLQEIRDEARKTGGW